MYSQSEVVNLILGIAMVPILLSSRSAAPSRHTGYLVAAYSFMLVSYVSTVAEGYVLPDVFNAFEHGALAAAGILFALYMIVRRRELADVLGKDA